MSMKFGGRDKHVDPDLTSQTVTGLRLSSAEIVSDYLKGRRPMTTPSVDQYDPSDLDSGFVSAYAAHEFLERTKSEYEGRLRRAREEEAKALADKESRLATLEAHYERTKHLSESPSA